MENSVTLQYIAIDSSENFEFCSNKDSEIRTVD